MRWIRPAPVTAEALVVCVALFLGCVFQSLAEHTRFEDVQREWGVIQTRHLIENHDGVRRAKESELRGPFDVWDGQWWRVPLTAFHHIDLVHLVMIAGAALYLGRLLEQNWGSFYTGLFLIPATCVPVLAELAFGNAMMGFSGAVCAMLGALTVQRAFDANLAKEFPLEANVFGVAAIAIGALATAFDVMPVANVSHFTGFIYGSIIAFARFHPFGKYFALHFVVILFHIWLIPALMFVTQPTWIGRYHWYRSTTIRNPKFAEKSLERAVSIDPQLAGAWLRLSEISESKHDFLGAWKQMVQGLKVNPSNPALMDAIRRMWRHLDSRQRRTAELTLNEHFGKQASAWLKAIRTSPGNSETYLSDELSTTPEIIDLSKVALDQKLELVPIEMPAKQIAPPLNHLEEKTDAVEGESL